MADKLLNDANTEKEALELERDSLKQKATDLEGDLTKPHSTVEDGKDS